jgi:ferredoxin
MDEVENKGHITRRQLLNMASPLGTVTLAKPGCTVCGNCAAICRTGALSMAFDREKGTCSLLFKHNLCDACGDCVINCPEQCLKLERALDIGSIDRPAEVLAEDEVVFCSECGRPFTSRAVVEHIISRLGPAGNKSPGYLEICPACKGRPRPPGVGRQWI